MKKSNLLKGVAAMAMGLAAVGCSHEIGGGEADLRAQIIAEYNEMFIKTFGKPASNQDWGFGGTRAHSGEWNGTHTTHAWESKLNAIDSEAELIAKGAVRIDTTTNVAWTTDNGTPVYYTPKADILYVSHNHTGELRLNDNFEQPCSFYNYGNITKITVSSANADVTFYNAGTLVNTYYARDKQVVYNTGTFIIDKNDMYAKISKLYNSGNLVLGGGEDNWSTGQPVLVPGEANIKTNIEIYSTGTGIVELPYGADWMGSCHIDGTVYTDGDIHFQNTEYTKYFCGIVSRPDANGNRHDLNVDGDITTSYILTNNILLNGDNIFLTAGGYIKANKVATEGNGVTTLNKEYEAIVVETNKTAMVDVNEFYLKNDKLGNHLGTGVYANFNTITYKEGGQETTATAATYTSDALFDQSRINNTEVGGTSECGGAWGNKTTTTTPDDDDDDDDNNNDTDNWVFQGRVFAEDLTASEASDFDFNDVVFDVYYSDTQTKIVLQAAGGTLPLYVEEYEVHGLFGVPTNVMVNTGTVGGLNIKNGLTATSDIYLDDNVALEAIKIKVKKDGVSEPIELIAPKGKATAKFAVTHKVKWCDEREDINKRYPDFSTWVSNEKTQWYTEEDIED